MRGQQEQLMLAKPTTSSQRQAPKESLYVDIDSIRANIRELENQQIQNERKISCLEKARIQRAKHRCETEESYEHEKQLNGTRAKHLENFRSQLSSGKRQLGARRLHGDDSSKKTRIFGYAIKKALKTVRVNDECRRKIRAYLVLVAAKAASFFGLKKKAALKSKNNEEFRDGAKQKLELLLQSIQSETTRARHYEGNIVDKRTQITTMEHGDLEKAQSTEMSMKEQAQTAGMEFQAELASLAEDIVKANQDIEESEAEKAAFEACATKFQSTFGLMIQQVRELREQLASFKNKEGVDGAGGVEAVFASSLKREAIVLDNVQKEQEQVVLSIESLKSHDADFQKKEQVASSATAELSTASRYTRAEQRELRNGFEGFLVEYSKATKELARLKKTITDLTETRDVRGQQYLESADALRKSTEEKKQHIESLHKRLGDSKSRVGSLSNDESQLEFGSKIEKLKHHVEGAETRLKTAQENMNMLTSTGKRMESEKHETLAGAQAETKKVNTTTAILLAGE